MHRLEDKVKEKLEELDLFTVSDENEYFKNDDIRDIVDEIKYLNNLSSSNLKIGDKLNIPTI